MIGGEVEVVAVVLRMGERCRLGVLDVVLGADVRLGEDVEPLGVGGHHPVLDAVVDHLHEVAGAVVTAVQPAVLDARRGVVTGGAGGRPLGGLDARCESIEDRGQPLDGGGCPPTIRQ